MITLIESKNNYLSSHTCPSHLALVAYHSSLAYPTRCLSELCPLLILHATPQNSVLTPSGMELGSVEATTCNHLNRGCGGASIGVP